MARSISLDAKARHLSVAVHGWSCCALLLLASVIALPASGQEGAKSKPQPKKTPPAPGSVEQEPGTSETDAETAAPPQDVELPAAQSLRERARQLASARSPILRLASAPNMFGDYFQQPFQFEVNSPFSAATDLATTGMLGRAKVAENNKAVTMNRVYFMVNYFSNALQGDLDTLDDVGPNDMSIERYTIGIERRFLDDLWSVDLRLPLLSRYDFGVPKFGTSGDEIGNLAVTLKRQLVASCTTGLVAGLSVETPTGDDTEAWAGGTNLLLHNDAVHLSPYLGFLYVPNDVFFHHAFMQIDVPLNGNRLEYEDAYRHQQGSLGRLNEQTLMHWDAGAGCWLYRNPCAPLVTGLASVAEFHYTTSLQDADVVTGVVAPLSLQFANALNRFDTVQCTIGLHAQLGACTTLRVGGVFPLNEGPERPFDAELMVSLNRYF